MCVLCSVGFPHVVGSKHTHNETESMFDVFQCVMRSLRYNSVILTFIVSAGSDLKA